MRSDADDLPDGEALSARVAEIEGRVGRLETALAERPATTDAVTDQVIARLTAMAADTRALPDADRVVVLDAIADARPLVTAAPEPPDGAVLEPPPPTVPDDPAKRRWFFTQLCSEVRLVFRMYFDSRYRISRTTQIAIPAIGLLLVFNYFLFSVWLSIPFLSPIVERVLAVCLGAVACVVLSRETVRYRAVLEYLANYRK
ncbi:MAG TPA: hypothetical protein VM529_10540 [Gemmata sp.]|nr:hypothetical protein [Gemmata sp.]